MLSWLIEKTAGAVRETYNAGEALVEYSIDTVTDIPDAISRGWDAGLIDHTEPTEETVATAVDSAVAAPEAKKFGLNK
jgi:hypothetical protein